MAQFQPVTTCEQLMYTTVRLAFPATGTHDYVGTGFFFDHYKQDGTKLPLVVTNRHVVEGTTRVNVRFHQRDTTAQRWAVSGYVDLDFPLAESQWVGHPNTDVDLAAIPLSTFQQQATAQKKEIAAIALGETNIPADLTAFDAIEEILMIGYPSGLWDRTNNYPLVRRGITASHPGIDFDDRPVIAMDMACFEGSSGSPVVLLYDPTRAKKVEFFTEARLFAFLGVLFEGSAQRIAGEEIPTGPAPAIHVPNDVGYLVKAREVATLARHVEASQQQP